MIQRRDGWMFLSHSSKDFELVRQIRNTLEDHGFRPITFFLKCITDSTELDGLIKREIEARRWFVFVDSENSRSSKWAQEELAYARALNKKVYTIDTRRDYLEQLLPIMKRTTVFLSYSLIDKDIAGRVRDMLIANDFQVFWDQNIMPGSSIVKTITNQITSAGAFLLLLSENSMNSHYVLQELSIAVERKLPLFPVLIGDFDIAPRAKFLISRYLCLRLSASPSDAELAHLILSLIKFHERNDL